LSKQGPLTCKLSPVSEDEDTEVDPKDAPPVDSDGSITSTTKNSSTTNTKKTRKRATILVETQVRRSPRVQKNKNEFKDHVCKDKSCLGYNFVPPSILMKTIRKLSASLCDIEASQVTDSALNNNKKKGTTPVGTMPPKKNDKEADDDANGEVED